ncbi:ethanolamine ammonia-lyase reactivating factor EutA [Paenibacillus abyssi]|uniref:Ethanolamine ammonia-lyase n=1 Tax=Paenibacillus abyssi TaxID=1340531 RepID=A0A917CWR1_9BACL|nr:ethanolamine ammonia-lyase reactivating factor EutA [Paenibacillus abyssi]GGG00949.1 ethanolamine ammonia-lyase [Paenibacillus abyssi]
MRLFYHDGPYGHVHDDEDHDHDLDNNMLWISDHIELNTVGIDIGSAGTQLIFSKLQLARRGEDLSSRYVVVGRGSFYRSPVSFTPYSDNSRIDHEEIARIVDDAYKQADMNAEAVHTGAVILTGEAIRRENAQAIGDALAEKVGNFVCATAGHNMEAQLAAFGSGAARRSYDKNERILNIDMGGGTTKLAVVEKGKVTQTAAIYIGGRLVVTDEEGVIVRLDPGGASIAERAGYRLQLGDRVTPDQLQAMGDWMAQAVVDCIAQRPLSDRCRDLYLTPELQDLGRIDGVMFSGGVAEFIYEREERDFGDLGLYLGQAFHKLFDNSRFPWEVLPAGECMRATVVGASEYTVQISGNTNYISDHSLLPKKNVQVLKPEFELEGEINPEELAESIRFHLKSFGIQEGKADIALAFHWKGTPEYGRVRALAEGIVDGLQRTIAGGRPLLIVLDGDLARTVGSILHEELKLSNPIVSIDGIMLQDFDFIDIGQQLEPSMTVPVTVKSLLFRM